MMADRQDALRHLTVSRETEERLALYVALLQRWQPIGNLVGPSTLGQIWTRHIADSGQLLALAPRASRWIDMGSGAGFPGLVIAICLAQYGPFKVHLIDSDRRKIAFLREVARQTAIEVAIHAGRIETVLPTIKPPIDVITARAVAPLWRLVEMSQIHLKRGAVGLFPKGQDVGQELTEATKCSKYTFELAPSITAAKARIVRVTARDCSDAP